MGVQRNATGHYVEHFIVTSLNDTFVGMVGYNARGGCFDNFKVEFEDNTEYDYSWGFVRVESIV